MEKEEKTIKSTTIYDGHVVHLRKDEVLCPNGNHSYREIVDHQGGVGILLIEDNKVVLVKQFRYAYKETIYEIPAGKIEKGEEPYSTGLRELQEETGYEADELIHLGDIYPSCGYTNEIIHLYYAKNARKKETHFDEDEFIETYLIPYEEVIRMIKNGKIKDAKTICAIMYYQELNK